MTLTNYNEKIEWLKENQVDVKKYPICFSLDWKSWKLMNEKPLVFSDPFTNGHRYLDETKDIPYKLVSRAGNRLLSEYLFLFATEDNDPEIPFFMLDKGEIEKTHKSFDDRVSIDLADSSVVLSLNGGIRYKMYNHQIEAGKKNPDKDLSGEIIPVYLDHFLPKFISYGHFDPDPLITSKNGKTRLFVSRNIPRWYKKVYHGEFSV